MGLYIGVGPSWSAEERMFFAERSRASQAEASRAKLERYALWERGVWILCLVAASSEVLAPRGWAIFGPFYRAVWTWLGL